MRKRMPLCRHYRFGRALCSLLLLLILAVGTALVSCNAIWDRGEIEFTLPEEKTEPDSETEDSPSGAESETLCNHDMKEVPGSRQAATCTENGHYVLRCTYCGQEKTGSIPATGHTEEIDVAVPATCEQDGLTAGTHCATCGEILRAQETVPALGHTEVTDEGVAPTCTEAGKTEGKHCSVCGKVLIEQKPLPAAHTKAIDAAVAPTCDKAGKTEGSHCSVCGKVLVDQRDILPKGHTAVTDAAVAPTCAPAGKTQGSH